jgi:hypothetical protein
VKNKYALVSYFGCKITQNAPRFQRWWWIAIDTVAKAKERDWAQRRRTGHEGVGLPLDQWPQTPYYSYAPRCVCVLCFTHDRFKSARDLHKLRALYITPEYCGQRLVKFAVESPLIPALLPHTNALDFGLSWSAINVKSELWTCLCASCSLTCPFSSWIPPETLRHCLQY